MMIVKKVENTESKDTPHKVDVRVLYNKDTAQAVHIHLKGGEALKPHITAVDVFFFVLEGHPTIQVGGEKVEVAPNSLVESPKDIVHCIFNDTKNDVRVLVVKAPKPTTNARLL